MSSGSPEKQEQNLDSNGTKGSTDGNGANNSGGSKKAVCSELNATESIDDVEVRKMSVWTIIYYMVSAHSYNMFVLLYFHLIYFSSFIT